MARKDGRIIAISLTLGVIFAFCYEIGGRIDAGGMSDLSDPTLYLNLLWKTLLSGVLIYLSWTWVPAVFRKWREKYGRRELFRGLSVPFWGRVGLLLLMWMPVFLAIFPGALAYDANEQWRQVRGWAITSHHPVIHTLLVGACLEGGYRLAGSYNLGIAVYTLLQMFTLAVIFSYGISFLRRYGVPALARLPVFLFWGLSPVVQLFSTSMTKDIYFSGVLLLFFLLLVDYSAQGQGFLESGRKKLAFVFVAFGTMILRNNGFYIVLVVLAVMFFAGRGCRRKLLPVFAGIAVLFAVYTGPVYHMLGVSRGGVQEMMSVPLQQMARTWLFHYNELEPEDRALLEELVPGENLLGYISTVSDGVKNNFNREAWDENKGGYVKLWIKWGLSYPMEYAASFLLNTLDYWYPGGVVDGYAPGSGKSDYFYYMVNEPGERVEMLPGVHEFYRSLSEDAEVSRKPGMFLLLSPGWYLLVFLYASGYFLARRRKVFYLPVCGIFILIFTVLMGPVALVRYVLPLFYVFPLLLIFMVYGENFAHVPIGYMDP